MKNFAIYQIKNDCNREDNKTVCIFYPENRKKITEFQKSGVLLHLHLTATTMFATSLTNVMVKENAGRYQTPKLMDAFVTITLKANLVANR